MEAVKMPVPAEVSPKPADSLPAIIGQRGKNGEKLSSPFSSMMKEKIESLAGTEDVEQADCQAEEDALVQLPVIMTFFQGEAPLESSGADGAVESAEMQVMSPDSLPLKDTVVAIPVEETVPVLTDENNAPQLNTGEDTPETVPEAVKPLLQAEENAGDTVENAVQTAKDAATMNPERLKEQETVNTMKDAALSPVNKDAPANKLEPVPNSSQSKQNMEKQDTGPEGRDSQPVTAVKGTGIQETKVQDMAKPQIFIENSQADVKEKVDEIRIPVSESVDVQRKEIIAKLADRIRVMVADNRYEISIQLKPESLGRVNLRLEMANGVLNGRIVVQNALVKETVENNLPQLRNSLEQQGIPLSGFSVDVRGGRDFARQSSEGGRKPVMIVKSPNSVYQDDEKEQYVKWNGSGTVDYLA